MGTYSADQLRELLDLWEREGGELSQTQIEALIEWEETSEGVRARLRDVLAERKPASGVAPVPLTPKQTEYLREQNLLPPPRRTLLQRLLSAIRGK